MVDRELHLPKSWTSDRERCRTAGVPDARAFATKTELARSLIARALASALPIAWVTADALYGQDWHFRRMLEEAGLGYVVAVPKSQQVKSLAGCWRIDQGPAHLRLGSRPAPGCCLLRRWRAFAPPVGTRPPQHCPPGRDRLLPGPIAGQPLA